MSLGRIIAGAAAGAFAAHSAGNYRRRRAVRSGYAGAPVHRRGGLGGLLGSMFRRT